MKKSLTLFFLMWMACGVSYARPVRETPGAFVPDDPPTISITFARPFEGAFVGNDLRIVVAVSSTFELARVEAVVEGRRGSLVFTPEVICSSASCHPGWVGNLSLSGLVRGEKTLTVTATDVSGNTGQAQRRIIYDRAPTVTVAAPLEWTVARPAVFIEATCQDDDPAGCVSLSVSMGERILARGKDGVQGFVSVPEFDGQQTFLTFTALDSRGQTTSLLRGIFVESSAHLSEVETVSGSILDVQPDRILFQEGNKILKIRDRATGAESVVMNNPLRELREGFLTPKGAIFWAALLEPSDFIHNFILYDWRDGALIDLGPHTAPTLRVKGRYAIWSLVSVPGPPSLILRDLVSGTNTQVSDIAGNTQNDVSASGDVVYWAREPSDTYNIYRYRQGVSTRLTNDSTLWNTYPLTDGINVVYRKHTPCCGPQTYATVLHGSSGEVTLSAPQTHEPRPESDYQLNGGWAAFTRPGTASLQVWTRSPAGEEAQVSFFGAASSIKALSPLGGVVFNNLNSHRSYLKEAGQPAAEVGSELGRYFWQDGQWFAAVGRTLFRVNTTPAPVLTLLTEEGTQQAIALNAVTWTRSPFSLTTPHNLSPDQRTRLMLMATNVSLMPGDGAAAVTVQAEDSQHRLFAVPVEYAGRVPNFDWLTQINVRLPEEIQGPGEVWLSIIVRGEVSNRVSVTIE